MFARRTAYFFAFMLLAVLSSFAHSFTLEYSLLFKL